MKNLQINYEELNKFVYYKLAAIISSYQVLFQQNHFISDTYISNPTKRNSTINPAPSFEKFPGDSRKIAKSFIGRVVLPTRTLGERKITFTVSFFRNKFFPLDT